MKHYLMDTSAYSRMADAEPDARRAVTGPQKLYLSPIILGELRAGFAMGTRRAANEIELSEFLAQSYVGVVPITETTADFYAEVVVALRRIGRPIPTNDTWIAASALEHDLTVLTADNHFLEVEGLAVDLLA